MTPEEIERTIEFILQCETRTGAHLQSAAQRIQEITVHIDRLTNQVNGLSSHTDILAGQTRDVQRAILILTELAQSQSRRLDHVGHKEILDRLDEILRRLPEKRN